MAEVVVTKSFRLTPELEFKLVELQELSGLNQSEIVRLALSGVSVIREKPSKELMNQLLKIKNIGSILNQINQLRKETGELDVDSLRYCISKLNSIANDIRRKYL